MERVEPQVASGERYRIDEKIGEAEVGTVFAAWDSQEKRRVAVKRLPASALNTPAAREQVLKEAHALRALNQANLVPIADLSTDAESSFAVMEFIEGENLHEVVHRSVFIQKDFVIFARQVLAGLDAAHRAGFLHHELKPASVMLNWQPDASFIVKLLNFGLARLIRQGAPEQSDSPVLPTDSLHTTAPERIAGEALDQRADLYSAGCLFYYVLTGTFPFVGGTSAQVAAAHLSHTVIPLEQYRPDLQAEVCQWVMQLISRQVSDRPESAKAADALLTAIVDGPRLRSPVKGPVAMVAKDPLPEVSAKKPRSSKAGLVILLLVLLGGGAGAGLWWKQEQDKAAAEAKSATTPTPPQEDPSDPLDSLAKPEFPSAAALQSLDPAAPSEVSTATDVEALRKFVGKHVILQGKVTGQAQNKAGTIDYLTFAEDPKSASSLVFFHRPSDASQSVPDLSPYIGHTVRADGILMEHRGLLQIAIRNASQISVLD